MSFIRSLCLSFLVAGSALAVPSQPIHLSRRAVDAATFGLLDFKEQYAGSAYCPGNNNSPNTKLSCLPANSCPRVEAADTTSLVEFEDSLLTDATGYVAVDRTNSLVVVSFRGSQSIRNWIANLNLVQVPTDICAGCKVHTGFWKSWVEARAEVLTAIEGTKDSFPGFQLVVTGHSLGGAIASLAAAELRKDGYNAALYTYGAPRIGNAAFADFVTAQPGGNFRVTHLNDPVVRLPPAFLGYRHLGTEFYITSGNNVPVTANDIQTFTGNDNDDGASGDLAFDIDAHGWYFRDVSACGDGDFEIKVREVS